MKKFLENLKAESWTIGSQVFGAAVTGALYLETKETGFLHGSCFFGILLICCLIAVWIRTKQTSRK